MAQHARACVSPLGGHTDAHRGAGRDATQNRGMVGSAVAVRRATMAECIADLGVAQLRRQQPLEAIQARAQLALADRRRDPSGPAPEEIAVLGRRVARAAVVFLAQLLDR
jgi:hypothetical protein